MNNLEILLYPGELPYSGLARLLDHHLLSQHAAFKSIFKHDQRHLSFHFSTGLCDMTKVFVGTTENSLLNSHTLFPLFARFRSPEQRRVLGKALQDSGKHFQFIKAKVLRPFEFKFCPECARADRQQLGETYWHREHQIPNVSICTKHKCFLETWAPPVEKLATRSIFSAKNVRSGKGKRSGINKELLHLANEMVNALGESQEIQPGLLEIAQLKGFIRTLSGKNFISSETWKQFTLYCSELNNDIKRGRLDINLMLNGNWKGTNPALYYLLRQYLATLPDIKEPSVPALPCINSICHLHNQVTSTTVTKVKVLYKKEDGFEVKCNSCGMVYRSSAAKSRPNHTVVLYGPLIKAEILKSQRQGETFKELGKRLGINARALSRIHDGKMEVSRSEKLISKYLLKKRRSAWHAELKSPRFRSLKHSALKLKTEYRWLMKNDKDWITHLNSNYRKRNFTQRKADFTHLDTHALKFLKRIYKGLIRKGTERRITKTLLLALLPDIIRVKIEFLPLSNKYIKRVAEDICDFKLRAITKAIALHRHDYQITKSELYETYNLKALTRKEREKIYNKFVT